MRRALVILCMALLSLPAPSAHAGDGFYFDAGGGVTFFFPTLDDGTWQQKGTSPPNFRLADMAWRVGGGYRFDDRWSVQAHYLDLGTAKVNARAVRDRDYDPVNQICLRLCNRANNFQVVDQMRGFDLSVTRSFDLGEITPFVRVGGALIFHRLTYTQGINIGQFYGRIPMGLIGVGACRKILCLDTTFYSGTLSMNGGCLGGGHYDCGYPIAKQVLTTMLSIQFN